MREKALGKDKKGTRSNSTWWEKVAGLRALPRALEPSEELRLPLASPACE